MKRIISILTMAAICASITIISCKNAKTIEQSTEEIPVQKIALPDSVLANIDRFADKYIETYGLPGHNPLICVLTEQEKLVKPDYLLDLDKISTLVSRQQKVNALGILVVNRTIRRIYDMPCDPTDEAIGRLAAELNIPFNTAEINRERLTEKARNAYDALKENGDVDLYWQWQRAVLITSNYIISRNPSLFMDKVTPEEWDTFHNRANSLIAACVELASVDSTFVPMVIEYKQRLDSPKNNSIKAKFDTAKDIYIQKKDLFEAKYNALLQ